MTRRRAGGSRLHATSMSMREAFLVNTSAAVFFLQSILFFHRSAHLQKPDELVNILFRCVVKLGTSRDFKLYMYSCHVDHIVFGCCTTFSWFVFFFLKKTGGTHGQRLQYAVLKPVSRTLDIITRQMSLSEQILLHVIIKTIAF